MDMTESIVPKSNQLNADDLLTGPRVFTITEVTAGNAEQPFNFHYVGGEGRPWKPCKSMRRVIVRAWGPNTKQYTGRSLELFCDPSVKWGGQAVGGIRISAMSHIDAPIKINLTTTRGKRSPFTVKVLENAGGLAESIKQQFSKCASMEDLRAIWANLPPEIKTMVQAEKEQAKQRLENKQ